MFINLSNHPSTNWSEKQLADARQYGDIVEYPFPDIPATEGEGYVASLSMEYAHEIIERYDPSEDVVHIMVKCVSRLLWFVCYGSSDLSVSPLLLKGS